MYIWENNYVIYKNKQYMPLPECAIYLTQYNWGYMKYLLIHNHIFHYGECVLRDLRGYHGNVLSDNIIYESSVMK